MSTLLYFALKIPHLPELCLCFLNSVIPPHSVTVSLSCAVVQKVPPGRKPRVIVVLTSFISCLSQGLKSCDDCCSVSETSHFIYPLSFSCCAWLYRKSSTAYVSMDKGQISLINSIKNYIYLYILYINLYCKKVRLFK